MNCFGLADYYILEDFNIFVYEMPENRGAVQEYFKDNGESDSIIDTKDLVTKVVTDGGTRHELSTALIITKGLRALTTAMITNSESSDNLSKVLLTMTGAGVCVGYSQVIASRESLSKYWLLGNIAIIALFIMIYYILCYKK